MNDSRLTWYSSGIYKGLFDGFMILAVRYFAQDGTQIAWHTTSYNTSGDFQLRKHWVSDGQFWWALKQTLEPSKVHTGDIVDDVPDPERIAILKAILEWSQREPDSA